MDRRPIGVFDSGVGGLTVVRALLKTLPDESIIYLGDTARVPYGTKSKETVTRFSVECVNFLKKFGIKTAVVACNTASSFSLGALKRKFAFPVIGVIEPGAKEACRRTRNSRIGVIGTNATVRSSAYAKEIHRRNKGSRVYQKACPLFVPLVEENMLTGRITRDVAASYMNPLKRTGIDTLILGCTHYPLLKGVIKKFLENDINIVDSSLSVSKEVKEFLDDKGLANRKKAKGGLRVFVTDDPGAFKKVAKIFLKRNIKVTKVALP